MSGTPPCVLTVDDHESNRELVERVLTEAGYVVEAAADPRQALTMAKAFRFDIYIVDFMMPMMTGRELVRWIRRRHPEARVLYLTAFAGRLFHEAGVLRDDEAFLEKPFKVRALREAVSLLLFGHLRGPGPEAAGERRPPS